MLIKLDENLGERGRQLFAEAGHDVSTVKDQGLAGAAYPTVIDVCRAEGHCLVTLDLDFSNPFLFPPEPYAGIAVIRLPRAGLTERPVWSGGNLDHRADPRFDRRKALDRRTASHPGVSAGSRGSRAMRQQTRDRPREGNQEAGSRPPAECGASPDRMRPPNGWVGRARTGCRGPDPAGRRRPVP